MLKIKTLSFNPFQVNTYILYNENRECIIVDPACYGSQEEQTLKSFIEENQLTLRKVINTHCHIDHILGNNFVFKTWNVKPSMHEDGKGFLANAPEYGEAFGFEIEKPISPEEFLREGDIISLGENELKVLETPGHADGSICLYNDKQKFLIAGDVLFHNSIGRTDLPTGNFETLKKSIYNKLFVLDDDVTVYCGHGPTTTIGEEKQNNPFL
ncbi:MAG: MBL fold metallo-hydrolase [Bacteroidota bacterium]